MKDHFGREISYLRLSVTDKCNLRCRYCMPSEGVRLLDHDQMLTQEEMVNAVKACTSFGVSKVRITGGEPLVKRNIVQICDAISSLEGVKTLSMTTNAVLLGKYAKDLKKAGVRNLNISLDTLDAQKFSQITRIGDFGQAWDGLMAALEAGFDKIKINAVLVGGFNLDQIRPLAELTLRYPMDVRFIELMGMNDDGFFNAGSSVGSQVVLDTLPELVAVEPDGGVASLYRLPGALGNVGLISPLSHRFCSSCNRIRITADGKVKPCLHSKDEYNLKGLDYEGMKSVISDAIMAKPASHNLSDERLSSAGRTMNAIGG